MSMCSRDQGTPFAFAILRSPFQRHPLIAGQSLYADVRLQANGGARLVAAVVFADRVFGHAGFPGEPGGGEARGGGELFQAAAEAAGDGVPHGTRLAGAFSAHGRGSKGGEGVEDGGWRIEDGGRKSEGIGVRNAEWRVSLFLAAGLAPRVGATGVQEHLDALLHAILLDFVRVAGDN